MINTENKTKRQVVREIARKYGGARFIRKAPIEERLLIASEMAAAIGKYDVSKKLGEKAQRLELRRSLRDGGYVDDLKASARKSGHLALLYETAAEVFPVLVQEGKYGRAMEIASHLLGAEELRAAATEKLRQQLRTGHALEYHAFETIQMGGLKPKEVAAVAKAVFDELMAAEARRGTGRAYYIASTWLGDDEKKSAARAYIASKMNVSPDDREWKRHCLREAVEVAKESGLEEERLSALRELEKLQG